MANSTTAAIVLAAGKGTRMKSDLPKVLHPIAGRPMIGHVLASLAPLGPAPVVVVVAPGMEAVSEAVAPHPSAIQAEQLGTGHAVLAAKEALGQAAASDKSPGDILILYGDTPFISTATFERLLARRRAADRPAVVVLGMRPADPGEYGRLIVDGEGRLEAIVEHRDATAAQRGIGLCNSGVMAVDGALLWELLAEVGNDNAKGEYYLTDIVALARRRGLALRRRRGAGRGAHRHQQPGRACRRRGPAAGASARPRDGRGRDLDRSCQRLVQLRYPPGPRCHHRPACHLRARGGGGGWRRDPRLLPYRGRAHRDGGGDRPFRAAPARQRHRGQGAGSAISSRPRMPPSPPAPRPIT